MAWEPYRNPVHDHFYDRVYYGDVLEVLDELPVYDVVLFIDVLEHFEREVGEVVLDRLLQHTRKALFVSTPLNATPEQEYLGNTYEAHSLPTILEKLRTKYHIQRVIVVAHRALITQENVDGLRKAGMDFILGVKLWKMAASEQEGVLDKTRYQPLDKEGNVLIRESTHKGERLVLTWSRRRAERDAALRATAAAGGGD